ncbi:GNAT family N-acetyltransferase [Lederbergia panacisoli]|uniref:GNAT family N-acetyltransferase n=1 Tax=Lederbergia panacisoli TaxID=1255251 RepID=UPI00214BD967|nr:GNAT family N-acetyltransferase [Lederbergia panacisoli]MCR2822665.1 GNAT family N-acetyltransferase [Lederbergia panacisoli]
MIKEGFHLEIEAAKESQLDLLVSQFSPGNPMFQYNRYNVQKNGDGLYLIAWINRIPIGHFLLRWSGPQDAPVTNNIDINQNAFLEAGLTIDEYRRMGVATAIILEGERLSKEKGCTHIGLEVGVENPEAKRLYERLGYKDWGYGEFEISWEYIDHNGNKGIDSEIVIFMQKSL